MILYIATAFESLAICVDRQGARRNLQVKIARIEFSYSKVHAEVAAYLFSSYKIENILCNTNFLLASREKYILFVNNCGELFVP